jgi:hypothetical protein
MLIQQWHGTPQALERLRRFIELNGGCVRPPTQGSGGRAGLGQAGSHAAPSQKDRAQ